MIFSGQFRSVGREIHEPGLLIRAGEFPENVWEIFPKKISARKFLREICPEFLLTRNRNFFIENRQGFYSIWSRSPTGKNRLEEPPWPNQSSLMRPHSKKFIRNDHAIKKLHLLIEEFNSLCQSMRSGMDSFFAVIIGFKLQ